MRSLKASSVVLSLLGIVYLANNAIGQPQSQLAQPQVVQDRMMGLGPTAPAPGQGTPLDPSCIPKYVDTLPLPTPMPRSSLQVLLGSRVDYYRISVRAASQNVLPLSKNAGPNCAAYTPGAKTNVFGYGTLDKGKATHGWPALTIEAMVNKPVKVQWDNELVDSRGNYIPHLLAGAIDQTLHWANPNQLGGMGTDMSPCMNCLPFNNCTNDVGCRTAATTPYTGPVPIVTHVHGNDFAYDHSDGWSEAWYMPNAWNIPPSIARVGSWYNTFKRVARNTPGLRDIWLPGSATFTYRNQQRPTQLWYHDHVVGITRLNVYAGMAGLYNLRAVDITRGPELPGMPYPPQLPGIAVTRVRELPIVIQDRAFDLASQLYYPKKSPTTPGLLPAGPVAPVWIPEFLGITLDGRTIAAGGVSAAAMVVNGKTWPRFSVQRESYRLRFLNGCNARTIIFYFSSTLPGGGIGAPPSPVIPPTQQDLFPFHVIGNEAGFFPQIVGPVTKVLLGPAERYDVIFDFSQVPAGAQTVYLLNDGPELPYNGQNNREGLNSNTFQIMRFDVAAAAGNASNSLASIRTRLDPALKAAYTPITYTPAVTRKFTLIENTAGNVVVNQLLGQVNTTASVNLAEGKAWDDPVTTNAAEDSVEDWEMINLTLDAHPIHIHESYFQVVSITQVTNIQSAPAPNSGKLTWTETNIPVDRSVVISESILTAPGPNCPVTGCILQKDTVMVPANAKATLRLKTNNNKGLFPWHCHLLEHEDNEMMRPWCVGQPGYLNPKTGRLMCPGPPGVVP